jgi:hypothetical protein
MIGEQKQRDDGFVTVATKVPPHVAELLNILAQMRGMEVYELLQLLVHGFISYAKAEQTVPDEYRHLYESLKFDTAWVKAYNFCSPTAQQDIAQMILILQQPGRKGFGMAMIDKPFMDQATMTRSIPDIYERMSEISLGTNDYIRLRRMNITLGTQSELDTVRTMLDAQEIANLKAMDEGEMPGMGDHEYGKLIEYGNRTKRKPHRTPDSIAQQRIMFNDFDRERGIGSAFGTDTTPQEDERDDTC